MKLLFLALTFLGGIISNGNCATAVMRPPVTKSDSMASVKSAILREAAETADYTQRELEDIKSTLGGDAYNSACEIIGGMQQSTINKSTLSPVFNSIKQGASQKSPSLTNLQKFENAFKANSSPSWGLSELKANIPDFDSLIASLNIETIDSEFWEMVIKSLPAEMRKSKDNKAKFQTAKNIIEDSMKAYAQLDFDYKRTTK